MSSCNEIHLTKESYTIAKTKTNRASSDFSPPLFRVQQSVIDFKLAHNW